MKKLYVLSLVAMSSAAWATHDGGYNVSDNANSNACFGQARAHDASGDQYDPIGQIFASRKGLNSVLNRSFREACSG